MDSKIKVCFVISDIQKALPFEWVASYLDRDRFEQSYILINPGESDLENFLRHGGFQVYRLYYHSKSGLPKAVFKIYLHLKKIKPDVVHTHLIKANLAGLLAGKLAGVKKRIYTRHHSSLHHIYFPKSVWMDKWINNWATQVVAISQNVSDILKKWEGVESQKVRLIHHGFDLKAFQSPEKQRVKGVIDRYHLEGKSPVVGVVARYTAWKGIQYILPAFKKFLVLRPDACLLLANAKGDYEPEIRDGLKTLPKDSYREIEFEPDSPALFGAMDLYIHVPIDEHSEAFGQTYVEALAAGVPSIFTLSGIAREFIEHGKMARVVPFKDSEAIFKAMLDWDHCSNDDQMENAGYEVVKEKFGLNPFIQKLESLYTE